jgi:hypothetical protein
MGCWPPIDMTEAGNRLKRKVETHDLCEMCFVISAAYCKVGGA